MNHFSKNRLVFAALAAIFATQFHLQAMNQQPEKLAITGYINRLENAGQSIIEQIANSSIWIKVCDFLSNGSVEIIEEYSHHQLNQPSLDPELILDRDRLDPELLDSVMSVPAYQPYQQGYSLGRSTQSTIVFLTLFILGGQLVQVATATPVQSIFAQELESVHSDKLDFELTAHNMPQFHGMIQQLIGKFDMTMPKVVIRQSNTVYAHVDPDDQSILMNSGLLTHHTPAAVEFVLAHELSHIKNKDVERTPRYMLISAIPTASAFLVSTFYYNTDLEKSGQRAFAVLMITMNYFKRCQEREADLLAVKMIGSPDGALEFFRTDLAEQSFAEYLMELLPDFFITHPSASTRIAYIEEAFKEND